MRESQLIEVVRYSELHREWLDIHQYLIVERFISRVAELESATAP